MRCIECGRMVEVGLLHICIPDDRDKDQLRADVRIWSEKWRWLAKENRALRDAAQALLDRRDEAARQHGDTGPAPLWEALREVLRRYDEARTVRIEP